MTNPMIDPVSFATSLAKDLEPHFGSRITEQVESCAQTDGGTRDIGGVLEVGAQIATIGALVWEVAKLVWARWKVVNSDDQMKEDIQATVTNQTVVSESELAEIIEQAIRKAKSLD